MALFLLEKAKAVLLTAVTGQQMSVATGESTHAEMLRPF